VVVEVVEAGTGSVSKWQLAELRLLPQAVAPVVEDHSAITGCECAMHKGTELFFSLCDSVCVLLCFSLHVPFSREVNATVVPAPVDATLEIVLFSCLQDGAHRNLGSCLQDFVDVHSRLLALKASLPGAFTFPSSVGGMPDRPDVHAASTFPPSHARPLQVRVKNGLRRLVGLRGVLGTTRSTTRHSQRDLHRDCSPRSAPLWHRRPY
jgi:hypothetical protein